MLQPDKISVIILAGGKSSRMGRDKALISIQGVPLIRHVCNVAMELTGNAGENIYIVTSRSQNYQALLPTNCQYIYEQTIQGPLVAFATALQVVKTEWTLLLACDLPHLNSQVLREGWERLTYVNNHAIAALARHEQGWEPLCGFYRQLAVGDLQLFLDKGGRSFQAWLQQHPVHELLISDKSIFFNCNTPADLQAISDNVSG